MDLSSLKNITIDYLKNARLMQIATVIDNHPWVCTVYFAFDKKLNLYWISKPTSRHSLELKINNKVAGAIVIPQSPDIKVRGLQFEGEAAVLSESREVTSGLKLVSERINLDQDRINAIINNTDGHLCYRIKPRKFVIFDQLHYPNDPRQELIL